MVELPQQIKLLDEETFSSVSQQQYDTIMGQCGYNKHFNNLKSYYQKYFPL